MLHTLAFHILSICYKKYGIKWTQKLTLFVKITHISILEFSFFLYISRHYFGVLKNYIFGTLKKHVPRMSSVFSIVAGWGPATLLKITYVKCIFQGPCKSKCNLSIKLGKFRKRYFQRALLRDCLRRGSSISCKHMIFEFRLINISIFLRFNILLVYSLFYSNLFFHRYKNIVH